MSLESVKRHLMASPYDLTVIEPEHSSATVELAAKALGVEPDRIAKTMAFWIKAEPILILSIGTARVDNRKFKDYFGTKAKMLKVDEVIEETGHPIGGVCPFGLKKPLRVFLDESLKAFESVYPAGGTPKSAIKITLPILEAMSRGTWVDVCKS